tara:strand:- start:62 stop:466 length:405 start_codon:yes stop_codon:yes gene_type:complete
MNKQDLELKISGLEKAIKEHNDFSATYQNDLKETKKQLEDYNKPALTPRQLDDIQEAIEEAVENYSFDDTENYEVEFGMEYDGKVHLESIGLSCAYELTEKIVQKVHDLFKEVDCPEELDTTEPDNHPVEKLQN